MTGWYNKITADLGNLPDCLDYFEKELEHARKLTSIKGEVQRHLSELPGITEQYFTQLQEVEAILNYLNIQLRKIRRKHFQKYLENYQRALSSRDVEKYVDGEDEVIDFEILINQVALTRNRYISLIKAYESKNFMLGHLTKLRCQGMEDFTL